MVESIIAQVDVVVTSSALVFTSFAGVAWVVLRACVSGLHNDAGSIASAVAAAVVLASDLESSAAHGSWAGRALTLANVSVPAVIAIALGAVRV